MTERQFARAAGADEKWVQNARRLLARRPVNTVAAARALGLTRVLHQELGLPLAAADRIARAALRAGHARVHVHPRAAAGAPVAVAIDVARYRSDFLVRLSRARLLDQPRRRGRRRATPGDPVAAAAAHGVDVSLLRRSLTRSPAARLAELDANAAFLRAVRGARPDAR